MSEVSAVSTNRLFTRLCCVIALTVGVIVPVAFSNLARAAVSTVSPVLQRTAANVTADALPTVQIDGVVWSQVVVGDTVYAGGQFNNARPAGAAPGTNLTPRANLLAYSISTGALIQSFAPNLNAPVKAVAKSPDGSTVYVGGSFTTANGVTHSRIAAYSTASGQLIGAFSPRVDAAIGAIAVTNSAVYVGGSFSTANGIARSHFAAFNPANGALLPWAPTADASPKAMVVTPDGSHVVVGGAFQHINGLPAYGLASVGATDGILVPFLANQTVRDAGDKAATWSLSTDGTAIYGSFYVFGAGGNFEGNLSADPTTGKIIWLADCHGDTYGTYAVNGIVYSIGHAHYCGNIGGFKDTVPRSIWHHTLAFTANATGLVQTNHEQGGQYTDFAGNPSPSLYSWLPDLADGTFTGLSQAAWSITGNSQYVVEGGEFPTVNGKAQQGLVRFAVPPLAPSLQGPMVSGTDLTTTVQALSNTSARVSVLTDWDRDDQNLTYTLLRNGTPATSANAVSQFWNRPTITIDDVGLVPGATYQYQVRVSDPDGNTALGPQVSVTMAGGDAPPTAAFSVTCSELTCSANAGASSDSDGTINSYAWTFGDGATGAGVTTTHTYGTNGTYSITLTVTDNLGATGSVSHSVSPATTTTSTTLAEDAFNRSVTGGFGTAAPTGGVWTSTNQAAGLSVTPGTASISPPLGKSAGAFLGSVAASDVDVQLSLAVATLPVGGSGYYLYVIGRRVNATEQYLARLKVAPGGLTSLSISKFDGSTTEVTLAPAVTTATVTAGSVINVRFHVSGTSSTALTAKAWPATTSEPASWTVSSTDTSAALQTAGSVGVLALLSGSTTNGPIVGNLTSFIAKAG